MMSTVSALRDPATEAMRDAINTVTYRGKALMGQVRRQPVAAVAVVALVAFMMGRMTR